MQAGHHRILKDAMRRKAVYLGTFDPVHNGHLGLIADAAAMFDDLLVLVGQNPAKLNKEIFTVEERLEMLRAHVRYDNVTFASTAESPPKYAKQVGARYIVRGVRDAGDAEAELKFAERWWGIDASLRTVWIYTPAGFSSSALKARVLSRADASDLCPTDVARRLLEKLEGRTGS
jgi:pantetheine-phosphate adenylyltransferase